jgi:uncharacterized protein (DUF433 family)
MAVAPTPEVVQAPDTPRIVRNLRILDGEPTVQGTRVPVRSVVINYERYAGDVSQVCSALNLDMDAVRQALTFYDAHREEIDGIIRENELAASTPGDDA